jgi:uncharacterized protein (DUF302 family)
VTKLVAAFLVASCAWLSPAAAESYFSSAKQADYRVALDDLSLAILDHGYTLVKIQPVDKGLRSQGYELFEDYKLVFFGNKELERTAIAATPELAALLPLKIILYQDKERVVAAAPVLEPWQEVFRSSPASEVIKRFDRDVRAILEQYGGTLYSHR